MSSSESPKGTVTEGTPTPAPGLGPGPAEYDLTVDNFAVYMTTKIYTGALAGGLLGAGYSYYIAESMARYTLTYSYGFGIATSSLYTGITQQLSQISTPIIILYFMVLFRNIFMPLPKVSIRVLNTFLIGN